MSSKTTTGNKWIELDMFTDFAASGSAQCRDLLARENLN